MSKIPLPGRKARRLGAAALASVLAAALSACASRDAGEPLVFERPETALDYEVELSGAPTDEVDALLRQSLGVFRRQEDGAASVAFLRRRAQQDVDVSQRVLRSFGYYQSNLTFEIDAPEASPADGEDGPTPVAQIRMMVEPGAPFILAEHAFLVIDDGGTPPAPLDAAALGSPVGQPAVARGILDAEGAAVLRLRNTGRPYAAGRGRDAVADLEANTLEVTSTVAAGPPYVFGAPEFEGLRRVEADYLRTWVTWEEGEPFDARKLADFQRALTETRLFSAVSARPPEEPPEGDTAPILVSVEEGKRRSVSAGVRFSTDTGPAARSSFEHRNLFGANETLNLTATAGLEEQSFEARYREPQYLRPGQDFVAGLSVRNLETDAFDETAATLTAGFERRLQRWWTVGAGGLLEVTETDDGSGAERFFLAGLPLFARYDNTDSLLDPRRGLRFRTDVTPFTGHAEDGDPPLFTRIDSTASVYFPLDEARNYVLAGRTRVGTIITENEDNIPASRRLYSGGGGSVRGYSERSIGPLDDRGDPLGGLSVLELGAELRAMVADPFGLAVFTEAGAVSDESWPSFSDGVQTAAGLGFRYISPVGPIRVDFAVPLNKRDEDDDFQFYLSIGQAF